MAQLPLNNPISPFLYIKCCTLNPRVGYSLIIACEAENYTRLEYEWQRTEVLSPPSKTEEISRNIPQEDGKTSLQSSFSSPVPEISWVIVSKERVIQQKRVMYLSLSV